MAINSFGFGGANAHVVLKSNPKPKTSWPAGPVPRLVALSGRTEESVKNFIEKLQAHKEDEEAFALVDEIHSSNIPGHGWRGYGVLGDSPTVEVSQLLAENRPIWFVSVYPTLS